MTEQNVSRRRRVALVLLRNKNSIAAYVGALFILEGMDANTLTFIGVGFLIGWFVDG